MAGHEQRKRHTIVSLQCAGSSPAVIIAVTGFPRRTVYDVLRRYRQRRTSERQQHKARSDRIRTPTFLAGIRRSIAANPGTRIKALAARRQVSETTVRRAIRDLGLRSYQRAHRHLLTEAQKQQRWLRARRLLNDLKSHGSHVLIFSDEKIFTVDRVHNRRNSRWICQSPAEAPPVTSSKKPASVMVFSAITSEGHVMPPFFFDAGQTVTGSSYLQLLKDVVQPWIRLVIGDRPYTFQQDSAPAHTAKVVQNFLRSEFCRFWPKDLWLANSPDCNPCDFYLWGILAEKVGAAPHSSVPALKRAITREMSRLNPADVSRACRSFRSRIEAVIAAKGGHIE